MNEDKQTAKEELITHLTILRLALDQLIEYLEENGTLNGTEVMSIFSDEKGEVVIKQ